MHTIIYKTTYNLLVWCLGKRGEGKCKCDYANLKKRWSGNGLKNGDSDMGSYWTWTWGQSWPPRRSRHIAHPFLFSLGLLSLHAFFSSRFSRFSTSSASSNFSSNFQHLSTVLFSKDPSQGGWQLRTGLTNMSPSRVRKRYFALPVTSSVVSLYQMHQTFWWSFRRFFESPTGTSREWLGTRLQQSLTPCSPPSLTFTWLRQIFFARLHE